VINNDVANHNGAAYQPYIVDIHSACNGR